MTVNDNAILPDQAQRISKKHAWAGFDADGELCCLFGGAELVVWARKDTRSSVATASLPYPVSHAVASIVAVQVDYQQTWITNVKLLFSILQTMPFAGGTCNGCSMHFRRQCVRVAAPGQRQRTFTSSDQPGSDLPGQRALTYSGLMCCVWDSRRQAVQG